VIVQENQIMTAQTASTPCVPAQKDIGRRRDDPVLIDLVARARRGDAQARDGLPERYTPLIWSICRKHRLSRQGADDVGQSVWLHLVDRLDKIREPAALARWLATTTRRECGRLVRAAHGPHAAACALDAENADPPVSYAEISARLGMPIGSIGPTRSRCLNTMRRYPALAALINATSYPPGPAMAAAS
jgi:DNA-directed RNA polymerase specialized sigma24 family protein